MRTESGGQVVKGEVGELEVSVVAYREALVPGTVRADLLSSRLKPCETFLPVFYR